MSVLVVGSVALDAVSTRAGRADGVVGGSATYFAAAASLLTDVRVVAVVGDDYPLHELEFLRGRGVDLEGLTRAEGRSFFWSGRYSADFSRRETLETRLGVFADFRPRVPTAYRGSRAVFLGNIDPELQLEVLEQMRRPELVAADTMNYWIQRAPQALDALLARVDVLLVNDEEARQLAREDDLASAAAAIRRRGPCIVVVKRGADGAVLFGPRWRMSSAAFAPGRLVDPTGAGDAFAGGLMGHLHRSGAEDARRWARALAYGAVMGSYAVEDFSVNRLRDLDRAAVDGRMVALGDARVLDGPGSPTPATARSGREAQRGTA